MSRSLIIFLIPFSLLLLSCGALKQSGYRSAGIPDEQLTEHLVPFHSASVYKADILWGKRNLSGIMVFKRVEHDAWRVVFLNELGMKFFDFKLTKNNFETVTCVEYLRKSRILKVFEQDFRLLLETPEEPQLVKRKKTNDNATIVKVHLPGGNKYYYLPENTYLPEKTLLMDFWNKKVTVLFETYYENRPDTFAIYHNGLKLAFHFKLLDN